MRRPSSVVGAVALLVVAACSGGAADVASTASTPTVVTSVATTTPTPTVSVEVAPSSVAPVPPSAAGSSSASTSSPLVPSPRATSLSAPKALIPAEFRGSWNTDPKDCGTDSEGMMVADARSLRFYEGGGPVTSVVHKGDIITVTATWNAEGTVQTEVFDLTISSDGEQVTNLTTDTVRHRCH